MEFVYHLDSWFSILVLVVDLYFLLLILYGLLLGIVIYSRYFNIYLKHISAYLKI